MLIKIQRILDRWGGNILCNLLMPFKPRKKIDAPSKILIINLWGMGDAVLTLPLIDQTRKAFPSATVDVLATKRVHSVYRDQSGIDTVFLLENPKELFKKFKKYDLVIDTEHYLNSSSLAAFYLGKETIGYSHGQRAKLYTHTVKYNDTQHIVHTFLDLLRVKVPSLENPSELVKLQYPDDAQDHVVNFLRKNGITGQDFVIGMCVSTAESAFSRRWAKEKFAKLADKLIEKYGAKIIIVSGPGDSAVNEGVMSLMKHSALNVAPEMNVKRTFAVIDQCNLFISNDTGPMHVGAAQAVPTVGLFGPNTPVRYGPYGTKCTSVYKPVESTPCINVHKGLVPDCKEHNHMSQIEVEDVLKAVEKLVEENNLIKEK